MSEPNPYDPPDDVTGAKGASKKKQDSGIRSFRQTSFWAMLLIVAGVGASFVANRYGREWSIPVFVIATFFVWRMMASMFKGHK